MEYIAKTPVFKTPLTDFLQICGIFTSQTHGAPQCQRFEMKYLNCMDVYGTEKGQKNCSDLFEDFFECQRGMKQQWRYNQMMAERMKKIKEGKLEEKYMKSPEPELIYPIRF